MNAGPIEVVRSALFPTGPGGRWMIVLVVIACLWIGFGSAWTGTTITMWGRIVPSYPVGLSEKVVATDMAVETLSFLVLPFYISFFNRVAVPLGNSFMTSQVLWLRLASVAAPRLLLARVSVVIGFIAYWGLAGGTVSLLIAWKHGLDWSRALVALFGPAAVFLFGGSWALGSGTAFAPSGGRVFSLSLIGMALPSVTYVLRETFTYNFRGALWASWFPAYLPFADDLTLRNIMSIAAFGMLGVVALGFRAARVHRLSQKQG